MGIVMVCLDVLASFLEVAATAPKLYVSPVLHDEGAGMSVLDRVRHSCLEVLDGMLFSANNVSFKQGKSVCVCLYEISIHCTQMFIAVTIKSPPLDLMCGVCSQPVSEVMCHFVSEFCNHVFYSPTALTLLHLFTFITIAVLGQRYKL